MKKILLILILITSCKKKEVVPEPTPTPICETHTIGFAYKYSQMGSTENTMTVSFSHNNCPTENENTYIIKGLRKCLKSLLKDTSALSSQDYTLITTETTFTGSVSGAPITFKRNFSTQQIVVFDVTSKLFKYANTYSYYTK